MRRFIKRVLSLPLVALAALFLFVEDVLWAGMGRIMAWLAKRPPLTWIEAGIRALPPYPTLLVFAAPSLLILPAKLWAMVLLASGQPILGLAVLTAAKIAGAAVLARIFAITKDKLRSIGWFAWSHDRLIAAKAWVYAQVTALPAWRAAARAVRAFRARFANRGMLSRRLGAARRWMRRFAWA